MTIQVRAAHPADEEALIALVTAAGLPAAGLQSAAVKLVAVEHDDIVGTAALEDHHDDAGRALLLRSVTVRRDRRGSGIGATLINTALDYADAQGLPVALLTETAPTYFPQFGFTPVLRAKLPTALTASKELQGACAISAHSYLRPPTST